MRDFSWVWTKYLSSYLATVSCPFPILSCFWDWRRQARPVLPGSSLLMSVHVQPLLRRSTSFFISPCVHDLEETRGARCNFWTLKCWLWIGVFGSPAKPGRPPCWDALNVGCPWWWALYDPRDRTCISPSSTVHKMEEKGWGYGLYS